MSATTLPSLGATHSSPRTVVEIVRAMSPEDKHDVFVALLEELVTRSDSPGFMPFENEDGEFLGYVVSRTAAKELADKSWAELPTAIREHLAKPVNNLDDCVSAGELIEHLSRVDGSTPQ